MRDMAGNPTTDPAAACAAAAALASRVAQGAAVAAPAGGMAYVDEEYDRLIRTPDTLP